MLGPRYTVLSKTTRKFFNATPSFPFKIKARTVTGEQERVTTPYFRSLWHNCLVIYWSGRYALSGCVVGKYFTHFLLIYVAVRSGFPSSHFSYISRYLSCLLQDTGQRTDIRINTLQWIFFNYLCFHQVLQNVESWPLTTSFVDCIMVNLCCLCCGEIPQPRPPLSEQSGPPRDTRSVQQQQPAGSGSGSVGLKGGQKRAGE